MREIVVQIARSFAKGGKNSKATTISGWAVAVGVIAMEIGDHFDLDPATVFEPSLILGAIGVAVLATFAKDNATSTEKAES